MNHSLLDIYLQDISKYPQLSPQQELTLATRARQGDAEAREQLIHAHLLMVVNIARQYQLPDVEMLDLIQEGNIGLIKAVDMFDPAKGNRLSTLARFWVEKYILRFLHNDLPEDCVSLDMPVVDSGETLLLSDTIADKATLLGDPSFKNIDSVMEHEELKELLAAQLVKLSPNEQEVLRLIFGLQGYPSMTREEISKVLNIQMDQISRIKTRALRRLKEMIK